MKQLPPKEAIERLETDPETDKVLVSGLKEIVFKQATMFPHHKPIIRFYDDEGVIKMKMDKQFRETYKEMMNLGELQ